LFLKESCFLFCTERNRWQSS